MSYSIESKVGELLANRETRAILDKHIPDLSPNPLVRAAEHISLKQVVAYSGSITPEKLAAIDAELALCKKIFSSNSTVGELLGNPKTRAVLDKHIPDFSPNPLVRAAHNNSLNAVSQYSGGTITPERLAAINADLAKL